MAEALHLWRNARIAACDASMTRFVPGALLTRGPRIEWVGAEADLPGEYRPDETHDLQGNWVTPGLIDCHTHLVFAGTRAREYAERLQGRTYQEIARAGGGILSSMRAVRAAAPQQLFDQSLPRLEALLAEGVTTVEVKSGYGLTLEDEAKMLRVARSLARAVPVSISTTLLAAHALPPEYTGRADAYVNDIAADWLPRLHEEGLLDAVDIFCENVGFSVEQAAKLFDAAARLGIPVKMHAEQLSNLGGSLLAASRGALSCDHLEYATEVEAQALAAAGTVAVLLPVAFFCLAEERKPPVAALRKAGASMAIATDCNPGSAPSSSLLLAMSMGTRLFGLTCEEALAGVTRHAARALGMHEERGTLAAGKAADFSVWSIGELAELGYWTGFNPCRAVVKGGRLVS